MKPNTIEIDEKGIFCYEAPELNSRLQYEPTIQKQQYQIALEQAKRDRVYFKDNFHSFVWCPNEQGKPYPIPDGYEVKIGHSCNACGSFSSQYTCDEGCKVDPMSCRIREGVTQYAILVPKEVPCPKCRTTNFNQVCHDMRCPIRGGEPKEKGAGEDYPVIDTYLIRGVDVAKQQSIEEAAAKYANDYDGMQWEKDRVEIAFIKGAKWYKQFKQEKL